MGIGGDSSTKAVSPARPRLDVKVPALGEIRKALPPHVFERDAVTSVLYVFRAIGMFLALGLIHWYVQTTANPETDAAAVSFLRASMRGLYWLLQGTVLWGFFTLGHDCGHSSFSLSPGLNWVVGSLLHTFILVPYESWRVSHRHHHQNTGNMDTDEIFFPFRKSKDQTKVRVLTFGLGFAWWMYLLIGYSYRGTVHLNPNDALFQRHRAVAKCSVSVAMFLGWLWVVNSVWNATSGWFMLDMYFIPVLVFGSWLVITTFLHHNEPGVPWFADSEWDFVKGALSSVDRDYTPFNSIIHNIGTHQIHHLFPTIPHYHLVEATSAFRKSYPHLVRVSRRPILSAFLTNAWDYLKNGCVDDDAKIYICGETTSHAKSE